MAVETAGQFLIVVLCGLILLVEAVAVVGFRVQQRARRAHGR